MLLPLLCIQQRIVFVTVVIRQKEKIYFENEKKNVNTKYVYVNFSVVVKSFASSSFSCDVWLLSCIVVHD